MDAIKVWRFEDAPPELQSMSQHGGDEDWIVLVPSSMKDSMKEDIMDYGLPRWIAATDTCRDPSEQILANGDLLIIGAH